ncbi:MAG: purine-nucleoside phosphorylase [Clostridia bacterium]|nr:purine-nucleoside phosphorylase [Clostridia bacterium]
MFTFDDYKKSADAIRKITGDIDIALVLGSGLGKIAEMLENPVKLRFEDVPNLPPSTVMGHAGEFVCGTLHGKRVLIQSGRFHYYEGNSFEQSAYAVRLFKLLGARTLILTNAAGGINRTFSAGTIMMITDHIKFFDESPLRGPNIGEFGPRFNDMSYVYSKRLRWLSKGTAARLGIPLKEGVYAFMPGPSFETPAEIRALGILGADAVGMSTVAEAITAAHAGLELLAFSCISNLAAGLLDQPLSHDEVMEAAKLVEKDLTALLDAVIKEI